MREKTDSTEPRGSVTPSAIYGELIDLNNTMAQIRIIPKEVSMEFRVRQEIRDPHTMYYQDKAQKGDLPTNLAAVYNCKAALSDDGRVTPRGLLQAILPFISFPRT